MDLGLDDMPFWLAIVLGMFLGAVLGFAMGLFYYSGLLSASPDSMVALACGAAGAAFGSLVAQAMSVVRRFTRMGLVVTFAVSGAVAGAVWAVVSRRFIPVVLAAGLGALLAGGWALFSGPGRSTTEPRSPSDSGRA